MSRRLHILCFLLIAAVLAAPGRVSFAQDDTEAFQKITLKQVMGSGWTEFERTFAALAADPRNDAAFQELSVVVGEAGALNKVTPYLETLVVQKPADATLRTILARVYKDLLRDPVRARTHFEAVLAQDAGDFFAHYQLAQLFARQGDKGFADAVAHYRAAGEKITRQHADLRTRILKELGELLYSRHESDPKYAEESFAAWDAIVTGVRKFDLVTYEELADEYRARSLWPKVEETYERYFAALGEIHDVPENVVRCRLRTRIGEARESQELWAKAVESYTEALGLLDRDSWQARKIESRVRECWRKLNRSADYERELRKSVADSPDSVAARQSLARALIESGRADDAASELESARKTSPRNVPVIEALEGLYRKSGRDEDLARILRARIELSPEDYRAYADLADLHVRAGRTAQAEKVLEELEASPSDLPEKTLLLARASARYGLVKRTFILYRKLIDSGFAGPEERFEFCDFCLAHPEVAGPEEASAQAGRIAGEGTLDANGTVTLANVFRKHEKNDVALTLLVRGLAATAKRPGAGENREAVFTLNAALSDLENRMGAGHHAESIGSTLEALLAAPDLHFKRVLNDRLVTLLVNYGNRRKLLYSAAEETTAPARDFGGAHGAGVAPWVVFLNAQANSREEADLWMLLGQIHETVEVDVEFTPVKGPKDAKEPVPQRVKTDIAQARLFYQKAIDTEFQNLDAHTGLARVLADPAVDEYEKAVNELEVLALLNPVTRWESTQTVGDLYANAGETALARERWRTVAEQSAGEPDLLEQVAMRIWRAGDAKQALDLSDQAVGISPYVFRYRLARANLLGRMSAGDPGTESAGRYVGEMSEALRLAEGSPALADFVADVKRGLVAGRAALGRRFFERGDFKAAREQFESAAATLKEKGGVAPDRAALADAEIQAARCVEALGDREAAMKRYAGVLADAPATPCWVSSAVTLSGRSFLALKQRGELQEGRTEAAPKPAGRVAARATPAMHFHDPVRAFAATGEGRLLIEASRARYEVDVAAAKLAGSSDRAATLGSERAVLLAAGEDRALMLYADDLRAVRPSSGETIWARPAEDLKRFGKVDSVRWAGGIVIVGSSRGVQALSADTGTALWERTGDRILFDVDGRRAALLAPMPTGEKELATVEAGTGKTIARRTVSGSAHWQPPVLAGEVVLLTDSLAGKVAGFDARTGEDLFTFALGAPPISTLTVVGDTAFAHTLKGGAVNVQALDLRRLRVRFDLPLGAGELALDALSAPPIPWKGRLLYLDAATGRVFALDTGSGKADLLAPAGNALPGPSLRWCLSGDTLCLVGPDGEVQLLRLSAGD